MTGCTSSTVTTGERAGNQYFGVERPLFGALDVSETTYPVGEEATQDVNSAIDAAIGACEYGATSARFGELRRERYARAAEALRLVRDAERFGLVPGWENRRLAVGEPTAA